MVLSFTGFYFIDMLLDSSINISGFLNRWVQFDINLLDLLLYF